LRSWRKDISQVGTMHQQKSAGAPSHPCAASQWEDGHPRSSNNCFTHCLDGEPHGYVIGAETAPTPEKRKRGPKASPVAFGLPGGPVLGSTSGAPIPRLRTPEKKAA